MDHITYWRAYASECDRRERVISFVTADFCFFFLLNLNIQSFTGNEVDSHLTSYLFVNGNPRYSYSIRVKSAQTGNSEMAEISGN